MAALRLGVMASLAEDPSAVLEKVHSLGLPTCQLGLRSPDAFNLQLAEDIRRAAARWEVEITACWPRLPGRTVWNFAEGPATIGLVPRATRPERVEAFKRASDFARLLGVPAVAAHMGFIPENPSDPEYGPLVETLREVAIYCGNNGQQVLFETGQETPITLVRAFGDIGMDNLGVNLDPANLLMYGKANPIDALELLGPFVRAVHAKDGEYPRNGRQLGPEKPLGEGRVDFPVLVPKLKSYGFAGALTIEREVSGPEQIAGIRQAIRVLQPLL